MIASVPQSPLLVAAAAMVDRLGRVLVQRRPVGKVHGGLWEFPGGKLEAGETPEAALARELREELCVEVSNEAMAPLAFASAAGADGRPLLLLLYRIEQWRGTPEPLVADAVAWHSPAALTALAMPPADRPLIDALTTARARIDHRRK